MRHLWFCKVKGAHWGFLGIQSRGTVSGHRRKGVTTSNSRRLQTSELLAAQIPRKMMHDSEEPFELFCGCISHALNKQGSCKLDLTLWSYHQNRQRHGTLGQQSAVLLVMRHCPCSCSGSQRKATSGSTLRALRPVDLNDQRPSSGLLRLVYDATKDDGLSHADQAETTDFKPLNINSCFLVLKARARFRGSSLLRGVPWFHDQGLHDRGGFLMGTPGILLGFWVLSRGCFARLKGGE